MEGVGISENEVNGVSQQQGNDQGNTYIPTFFPLNEKVQQWQETGESKADLESIHCNERIPELGYPFSAFKG
jgi:peptide methionine sulfoxide reductase MsrA